MSEKTIFAKLMAAGMTEEGAAGMLGNIWAESNCEANRKQGDFSRDRWRSKDYTQNIDSGVEWFNGKIGYGLCQWTYKARQENLYNFAKERGASVGDEDMQVDFILWEMHGEFRKLFNFLCETEDIYAAADAVCRDFERPAKCNVDDRYEYAMKVYERCANKSGLVLNEETVYHLQSILKAAGYKVTITGKINSETSEALKDFADKL